MARKSREDIFYYILEVLSRLQLNFFVHASDRELNETFRFFLVRQQKKSIKYAISGIIFYVLIFLLLVLGCTFFFRGPFNVLFRFFCALIRIGLKGMSLGVQDAS